MNFCRNCVYFLPQQMGFMTPVVVTPPQCSHPDLLLPADPVYGYRAPASPFAARCEGGGCGPEGKHFTKRPAPKPQPKPARKWWQVFA